MKFGYSDTCLAHDTGERHPETADRLRAIRQRLESLHGTDLVNPAPVERAAVTALHDSSYVDEIEEFCAAGGGAWDADTRLSERSWEAALASAGLACWAGEEAAKADNSRHIPFALGRPPGHHATADEAMGFCIFNNVAIAAQRLLDSGTVETVAVVDWDVHHGNGTQAIFLDRADVAYASIHEHGLYPGTGEVAEIGSGPGTGATLNVPLRSGANTAAFVAAIDEVIDPWLAGIDPDLLLVSAGFDAHRHDPISRMAVDTEGFGLLTARLLDLVDRLDAPIGFVLEGGYGLETLADGVAMVHEVCSGYDPTPPDSTVRDIDREVLETVRVHHGLGS